VIEICPIKNIVELSPELDTVPVFPNSEVLVNSEINVGIARPFDDIPSRVPEGVLRWKGKSLRVEPLLASLRSYDIPNHIGTLEISARTGVRVINGKNDIDRVPAPKC